MKRLRHWLIGWLLSFDNEEKPYREERFCNECLYLVQHLINGKRAKNYFLWGAGVAYRKYQAMWPEMREYENHRRARQQF